MAYSKKILKIVRDFQKEMQQIVDDPKSAVTKITFETQDRPPVTIAKNDHKKST